MTDKIGVEIPRENSLVPPGEIPYRFDNQYNPEEEEKLRMFMHADFPHITYGGVGTVG